MTDSDPTATSRSTLIGVAICTTGNILISLALNLQKLAHERLNNDQSGPAERQALLPARPTHPNLRSSVSDPQLALSQSNHVLIPVPNGRRTPSLGRDRKRRKRVDRVYLRSRLWWAGLVLLNVGELGNFTAYAFSPASLVAPLGTVALVANAFWAPLLLKEPFRKTDLVGIALTVIGGVTVVYASKSSDTKLFPAELLEAIRAKAFIAYAVFCAVMGGVLASLSGTRYGERYVMVDIGLCAFAGGFTVLATKAFSSFLSLLFLDTFRQPVTYPILAVLISTALVQVNYINKALQRFESRIVIPAQFCSFSLSAIVGSAVLYRDFDDVGLPEFLNFAFGVGLSALGVYLLTKESATPTPPPPIIALPPPTARTPSDRPLSVRARTLSMTLGGGQYLLAQSPGAFASDGGWGGPVGIGRERERERESSGGSLGSEGIEEESASGSGESTLAEGEP